MNKFNYILLAVLFAFVGCKKESMHYTIDRPADEMHIHALQDSIVLDAALADSVALTLTWDWLTDPKGSASYEYILKMDVADNSFQTSIPKMPLAGDNVISFTHKQMSTWLEKWGAQANRFTLLEVEIIASLRGSDIYVKPMISTCTFSVRAYASMLYLAGSATSVGTDFSAALPMDKVAGEDAYTWQGLLLPGEVVLLSEQRADAAMEPSFRIDRAGWYTLYYDLAQKTLAHSESLYLIGDATPGGWALTNATEMANESPTRLKWTGVLNEGELKFACHPQSGDWFEPFYVATRADESPEGTTGMVFNYDGTADDNKWRISEAGIYTITVDLEARTATFVRDHSMDDLPVKSVWICGDATPSGWNTPFPEKMNYDFSATKGTFVWEGTLRGGEIKFPCNASQYEGAFYLADDFNMAVTPGNTYHLNYFASTEGVDDKKWIISEAGSYKITINVIDNTLKFIKQ